MTGRLLVRALGVAMALFACAITHAATIVIDNGLAPPNPDNVIDAADDFAGDDVIVLNAFGGPTAIEVVSGGSVGRELQVFDSSSIAMTGGSVGCDLEAFDSSSITMSGGFVGCDLQAAGSTSIMMSGGTVDGTLFSLGFSSVEMSGGLIQGGGLFAGDSSSITVFGSDFAIDDTPVAFGPIAATTGTLTGMLASGESINNAFFGNGFNSVATGTIVLASVAEPPVSFLISLGLAGLALGRGLKGLPQESLAHGRDSDRRCPF